MAEPARVEGSPEAVGDEVAAQERALVERARTGDADAFRALVVMRLRPTFRLTKAILGTSEEAEDATQEAFLAAWRGLPALRDPSRFDAWFGRIVVNACRMSLRRRPRLTLVSVEAMSETGDTSAGADDGAVGGVADADVVQRAIDRLTIEQRTILALRHLEERSVGEISRLLAIPVGTAKWRLHAARAALERAMAAER